jgi:hypothetical protein
MLMLINPVKRATAFGNTNWVFEAKFEDSGLPPTPSAWLPV